MSTTMTDDNPTTPSAQPGLHSESQKRGIRYTLIGIVLVVVFFMSMFTHKILSPRILSNAELLNNRAVVFDQPRIIKPINLLDHQGDSFTLKNFEDKWTLIYFGFTHCPDICPTTLAKMNQVVGKLDQKFADQVQVAMVTVDPARDTQEKLAAYVPFFNPEFIGVGGEFLDILKFTQNLNVAFNKVVTGDTYTIDHTGNLALINPRGHYHGFFKPPFELAAMKVTLQSIIASDQ